MKTKKFATDLVNYITHKLAIDYIDKNLSLDDVDIDKYTIYFKNLMINKFENTNLYDGFDNSDYTYVKQINDIYTNEYYKNAIKCTIEAIKEVMEV